MSFQPERPTKLERIPAEGPNQRWRRTARVVDRPTAATYACKLLLTLVVVLTLCGCFTARSYIADKTQIELTNDISVCSQGVEDFRTCEPGRLGGAKWVFNDNFDVFAVTGGDNYQISLDQIRMRYLGTPYYHGSLHLECHDGLMLQDFPNLMLADDVDLASELQRTTVMEIAAKVVLKLRAQGVDFPPGVEAQFRKQLNEDVASKVGVRFFWFLTKWTGGKDSIRRNHNFKSCLQEVDQQISDGESASIVTGVAGLMVLSNRVDTTVSSESTILAALSATVPQAHSATLMEMQGEIAAEWKDAVQKKFTVRGSRTSISQTVYPLWIQFE
jgi:hypothetical protein